MSSFTFLLAICLCSKEEGVFNFFVHVELSSSKSSLYFIDMKSLSDLKICFPVPRLLFKSGDRVFDISLNFVIVQFLIL